MSARAAYLLLGVFFAAACSGSAGNGSPGTGGSGGTIGPGGTGMSTPPPNVPVVVSFTANPAVLPMGGGAATLSWEVMNADNVSIDHGIGDVTGTTSAMVNATTSTIYTLTASNSNGSVTAVTAVGVGQNPARGTSGRSVSMVSPTGGESFIAPTRLRLIASGRDPLVDTNTPSDGLGGNAARVQFFVDDQMVLTIDGGQAEYWVFKGFADGIGAGQHRVWARAIYTSPAEQLDSLPMIVTVYDPPAYAMTMDLSSNLAVPSGGLSLVGSASGRIRVNGHGHSITGGGSGAITFQYVDFVDLGDDSSDNGMEITTSGGLTIEDCTFDNTSTISASVGGSATASVKRNVFRSNMRMPIGQQPTSPDSFPAALFRGSSTGAKVFAGNNVGAGWVEFTGVRNWMVGGPTDADSNVLIGPRVGITVSSNSSGVTVQRNFSNHVYFGGWSQGANFELQDSPSIVVEHNVIYNSSWPVRGAGCEFRYNLVHDAGHQWLWPEPNGSIHHNIFVGGDADIGGIYQPYSYSGVKVFNNTIDGINGWTTAVLITQGSIALTSNAFVNVPDGDTVSIEGGTLTTDYNFFDNPQANYSDSRRPTHDVGGEAMLTGPQSRSFDLDKSVVWTRGTSTAAILALYRMRYLPKPGSPLIDAGDPAGGAGNDIGAVGAGTANANDKFGQP